jgi:uncharacterized repeat protein (TIGR04076 family)
VTVPPADVLPGSRRVRVIVDRADAPRCDIAVGDYFEVDGSRLSTPNGPFCPYAMAAVFPVLALRQGDLPVDDWLARKPWICCPDASENVVMRLVGLDDGDAAAATGPA